MKSELRTTKIVITDPVVAKKVLAFFEELNRKKKELQKRFSQKIVK